MELNQNLQILQSVYANCPDVIFHNFIICGKTNAVIIYIEGMSNTELIDQHILAPLMLETGVEQNNSFIYLKKKISVSNMKEVHDFSVAIEQISIGKPVILIEGEKQGISFGLAKMEKRGIEEPQAESVVRGPREGFTETLAVNTSLLRRKIKSPQLKLKPLKIGRYSQTQIMIAYIEGIADPTLIEEITNRLKRIDIDGVLESGYLEEFIEDSPFSPFPQLLTTERPDVATAALLEGRSVILVDGTPISMVAPTTFFSLLQSPDDYYQRFMIGTLIRWLRYLFFSIALVGPSTYVAVLTYHQEMLPSTLLISIANSRENIPFPALVEALLMEITFEALREAGVRLPKQVGAAVSIVGALVVGQAATAAGIVSSPMVMVVAITGIASFVIPHYTTGIALRMLRFPLMFLAGMLGLLGLMMGVIVLFTHLCMLRSFGVPYLTPLAPMKGRDLKDVLFRAPIWKLNSRPHLTGEDKTYRQSHGQKPDPTRGDES
ncbi:spore germination protein [Paenibacillus sp. LMG 31460]|uniref:Spore germination protein n=2 Tax=Paenibacillus germinis TaxID=2654979 RepID=A0ABX1Z982_9BACL|nr:spore germination protein [Paenibacillus germinis]NOU88385.1 spore germination protein [Paenibacillus germinis]